MLPAIVEADFAAFSEALYEFGRRVGECFSAAQGGAYLNDKVADLVARLRQRGVHGVGQTSWGPTVFALARDAHEAGGIARHFDERFPSGTCKLVVTPSSQRGARLERR
jgi:predicted sugar kinase